MNTSLPVTPAQPNTAAYGTSALQLFKTYSRASYEGVFGVQPPPFDPSKPIKAWFQTDASGNPPASPQNFSVIVPGSMAVTQITLDPATCASVNLTGDYRYPKWTNSGQTVANNNGLINGQLICLLEDAQKLAISVALPDAPSPVDETDEEFSGVTWGSEVRRAYRVKMLDGTLLNAATLLYIWAARFGLGAPGKWNPALAGTAMFTPTPEVDLTNIPVTPVPIRALLPGEVIQAGPLGMGVEVVNTNLTQPQGGGGTVAVAGGLTDQQAAQLATIFAWVTKQP